jgi:hypothetical protein
MFYLLQLHLSAASKGPSTHPQEVLNPKPISFPLQQHLSTASKMPPTHTQNDMFDFRAHSGTEPPRWSGDVLTFLQDKIAQGRRGLCRVNSIALIKMDLCSGRGVALAQMISTEPSLTSIQLIQCVYDTEGLDAIAGAIMYARAHHDTLAVITAPWSQGKLEPGQRVEDTRVADACAGLPQKKLLAFAMGAHARLGSHSVALTLSQEILKIILLE